MADPSDQVVTRRTADEQAADHRPSTRRNNRQPDLTGVAGAHRDAGGRQLWYAEGQQRANKVRWGIRQRLTG